MLKAMPPFAGSPTPVPPAVPSAPIMPRGHRRDIDGLRAIAVWGVILVHAGVTAVSGGFLGVDVFFVISGFLIHGHIARDIGRGTFRPLAFYGRRMRRTLPALFAMVLACLFVGAIVALPGEFDALARSAIAAALSVSNIFFLNEVGYFDHDALTKPLLHTWSLGVEEQFYLVAPLISAALYRARATIRAPLTVALILATLVVCVIVQRLAPDAAFYLMPTRIWEFLIGCALAEGVVPRIARRWLAEGVAAFALLALLGSFAFFDDTSPHPGLATIVPCLATAALIHVGTDHTTLAGRWLSNPLARFFGLISYSLYLWHWPLIVFATDLAVPRTPLVVTALVVVLVAISALSWRMIEQPFRAPGSLWRRRARPVLGGALASILVVSGVVVAAHGAPRRFPPDIAEVASYFDYANRRNIREGTCFISSKYGSFAAFDQKQCLDVSATKPNYVLLGDSLAAHTWIGLSRVLTDINVLQATASGCKPVLHPTGKRYCTDLVDYILDDFVRTRKIDGLILVGAWTDGDAPAIGATVAALKRFVPNIFVIGPPPAHDMDLPNLIGRSRANHDPGMVLRHQQRYPWGVEADIEKAVGDKAVVVSQLALLCPGDVCRVLAAPNVPFQYDKSHMTTEGSILVAHLYKDHDTFAPRRTMSQVDH